MQSYTFKIQNLLILVIYFFIANCQKECFTSKPNQAINISQSEGPLKMSLMDPMKNFETGIIFFNEIQVLFSSIFSGSYIITNTQTTPLTRYNCFNLTLLYINPKSQYEVVGCNDIIILAIQNIENYQDNQGIDFSARFSPAQSIIECLFIMSHTANWTSVTIHYIISAREDFRVGTFIPDSVDFLPCGKTSEQSIISHRLVREWNASDSLVFGITFLAGIRTIDTELNVTFGKSSFDANKSILTVPVNFSQVQYPIEYMLISYLIVTMSSDFQITNIYDLQYIPNDINVFVGMTGIRLAPEELKGLKSTANISNILSKTKFQEFFGVQGLVIQSSSTLDILFSDGNYSTENIVECVSSEKCYGYDGYMKYYQNENNVAFHSECILCEKYASYNNKTEKCECRDLYVRINGSCIKKDELCDSKKGEIYNETIEKCECMSGYEVKDNSCVQEPTCPEGFTYFKGNCYKISTTSSTIQTTVSANTSPTSEQKEPETEQESFCTLPAFYNETTKCCSCESPLYFDETTKKCLSCGENEVFNLKTKLCVCMDGAFRIKGICDVCSANGFFNGSKCQCLPGYLGTGKICRVDPKFVKPSLSTPLTTNTDTNNQTETSTNLTQESGSSTGTIIGTVKLDNTN